MISTPTPDGSAFLTARLLLHDTDGHVKTKGGRELDLGLQRSPKANKFDKKANEDSDLYRWSSLRSSYVAEANVDASGIYAENGWGPWGMGWWGADWYWDPWFDAYTFIPGDGIFYSPFGWGFYSPWCVYGAPYFGYGYYGFGGRPFGHYGYGHYYHHFSDNARSWDPGNHYVESRNYSNGIYRGPGSTAPASIRGPECSVPRVVSAPTVAVVLAAVVSAAEASVAAVFTEVASAVSTVVWVEAVSTAAVVMADDVQPLLIAAF